MATPFWCLLIAILIPYVLTGITVSFKLKAFGEIDNRHPRSQAAALTGAGARAVAAQQNAWEALLVFGFSVMVAQFSGVAAGATASLVCVIFVLARIGHAICYIADLAVLRTLCFVVGTACCLTLFGLALAT